MLGSLLSDLGLLSFDPPLSEKIRSGKLDELPADQSSDYRSYPRKSLQLLLDRKLQITEAMRTVICSKHERADGTGFPNRLKSERIPDECRYIFLGDLFDVKTAVKMGQKRKPKHEAFQEILNDTNDLLKVVGPKFLPVVNTLRRTLPSDP
jgi:HD-GYP domain-containing protein (c-di-GMP phosphodiesterase class II)